MARIFGKNVTIRKKPNYNHLVVSLLTIVLLLWIGGTILDTVRDIVYDVNTDFNTSSYCPTLSPSSCVSGTQYTGEGHFEKAFDFLGLDSEEYGNTTGFIVVIGILVVTSLALSVIKIG